jgi:hypothetical protein
MRRLIIFATVALLGFAPLGLRTVSAQERVDYAWQGVTVEEPAFRVPDDKSEPFQLLADFLGEPNEDLDEDLVAGTPSAQVAGNPSMVDRLDEVYRVVFRNPSDVDLAHIPEVQGAEFMVVIVESGEFVVDVKGPGSFLIDPGDGPEPASNDVAKIEVMRAEIIDRDSDREVHYIPTGQFVLDEKGMDCTSLCTVLPGVAVQLTVGDRIIAPAGAICIWCLLYPDGEESDPHGALYVFPLLDNGERFTWSRYDLGSAVAADQGAAAEQNGFATPEQLTGAAPWALFNPSTNCRR